MFAAIAQEITIVSRDYIAMDSVRPSIHQSIGPNKNLPTFGLRKQIGKHTCNTPSFNKVSLRQIQIRSLIVDGTTCQEHSRSYWTYMYNLQSKMGVANGVVFFYFWCSYLWVQHGMRPNARIVAIVAVLPLVL